MSHHLNLTDEADPEDFASQVRAMSRLLARVADDLAQRLTGGCGR